LQFKKKKWLSSSGIFLLDVDYEVTDNDNDGSSEKNKVFLTSYDSYKCMSMPKLNEPIIGTIILKRKGMFNIGALVVPLVNE
jgi:hypothetical protein